MLRLVVCRPTIALRTTLAVTLALAAIPAMATEIPGIGPKGEATKLHGGFTFTEGPAIDRQGNLYFTDVPIGKIYKVDTTGKLSVFHSPSNNSNGLMCNERGELVACEMGGRIVAHALDGSKKRVVAAEYQGQRFNAPNDLVLDSAGGVYFTDPGFRAPNPLPQGKTAVYYVSAEGVVTRLIDDLPNPNGVILSPKEDTLYVIPSGQAEMMAYPVESPGKLGAGRVFCKLAQPEGGNGRSGGDGLTIDSEGRLYITSALGLQVFSAAGEALGVITVPQQPSNVTFGGEGNHTLLISARTSVYAIETEATGHVFPGAR